MPLLSILTAVHPSGTAFIDETMTSIATQHLPPDWDLEWVVQEDGPLSDLGRRLSNTHSWVKYDANGDHLGIGLTRNLALARARGQLIQNLDSDDLLLPDAFNIIARFKDSNIHWAIGQADDLLPDGTRKRFTPLLPFGLVTKGVTNTWAEEHGGNWPLHCAGLMMRTSSLRAVGGYAGLPFDDDIAMFAALSEATDGWWDEQYTWLYRQHSEQTTRKTEWTRWSETCRRIALQRARSVRYSEMSLAIVEADTHDAQVDKPSKTGKKRN